MLSQNATLLRICVCLGFLFLPFLLPAQEICDNGIDDDGDGLVDLLDASDCNCRLPSANPSLLPNPSLEAFSAEQAGCRSVQPGGLPDGPNQADCLVGWQRPSLGTTDSWNATTLNGSGPDYPSQLPLPLPSGSSVAGFFVGIRDTDGTQFINADGSKVNAYREYLATCLEDGSVIEAGSTYTLTFSLGFAKPQTFQYNGKAVDLASPSGVELSIYGIRRCDQIDYGYFQNCPEEAGAEGYELLANVQVDGQPGSWTTASVDFTSQGNYAAFAVGGSCGADIGREHGKYYRNYYFIDDLLLNLRDALPLRSAGPVTVSPAENCPGPITLSARADATASYQWYRDGVALVGQTERTLSIDGSGNYDGAYAVRLTWSDGCAVSESVTMQRPVIPDQFPEKLALCPEGGPTRLIANEMPTANYQWSDGSEGRSISIATPGTYAVTVTAGCARRVERILVEERSEIPYRYVMEPAEPCLGDTVNIHLSTDWYSNGVLYMPSSGGYYYQSANKPLRVVAGQTDRVSAMLFTGCSSYLDTIEVPALKPFVAEANVTDLNCRGKTGRIDLTVTEGVTDRMVWWPMAPAGLDPENGGVIVDRPGTYSVLLQGKDRCTTTFDYEVADRAFALDVIAEDVSCVADGTASAFVSGGTPPYRLDWRYPDDSPPVKDGGTVRDNLPGGHYLAKATDAAGCIAEKDFTVSAPEPLSVRTHLDTVGCAPDATAVLEVAATGGTAPYTFALNGGRAQSEPKFDRLPAGVHQLTVTDAHDCPGVTRSVQVRLPDPVSLDLGGDLTVEIGKTVEVVAELSGAHIDEGELTWWCPGSRVTPEADFYGLVAQLTPERSGYLRATFTREDGCTYHDEAYIEVDNRVRIYTPTAFSPNGDGVNDRFSVYTNGGVVAVEQFRVFDRWGGLVYASDKVTDGWDGTSNGQALDPGTYVYTGFAQLRQGGATPLRGTVLLTR